jgi:hypothetical protein
MRASCGQGEFVCTAERQPVAMADGMFSIGLTGLVVGSTSVTALVI